MALSLSELTKLYGASNKPPPGIEANTVLPGITTLEKLSKLYYTRETSRLFAAPCSRGAPSSSAGRRPTIAICVVIVDELYHEAIWRDWIEQSAQAQANYDARLFIHAKFPERITSGWVKPFVLPETFRPEWNSPEVIRAMLAALGRALADDACGRFVFATESCIPIYSLEATGQALFAEDASWLNAFDAGKTQWETGACFRSVDAGMVPERAVWKAIPGWIMLIRRHAAEICNLQACVGDDLVRAWGPGGPWREGSGVWAPEEVFFATMLSLLGYLRRGGAGVGSKGAAHAGGAGSSGSSGAPVAAAAASPRLDQVRRKMVTYATFARSGEANPVSFDRLTPALLSEFREGGSLFARKFGKGAVSLAHWRSLVMPAPAPAPAMASALTVVPAPPAPAPAPAIAAAAPTHDAPEAKTDDGGGTRKRDRADAEEDRAAKR